MTASDDFSETLKPGQAAQAYAPYLRRVRLMLLRYVLVLETQEKPNVSGLISPEANPGNAAFRCLMGLPLPEERFSTVETIEHELSVSYETLFVEEAVESGELFEQVRLEFNLSDIECDALWLMLAPALVPEYMWLCRVLWGDIERKFFDRVFLFHALDPFALHVDKLVQAFDPTETLLAQRLVVELVKGNQEEADGLLTPSKRLIRHLLGVQSELPNVPGLLKVIEPDPSEGSAAQDPSLSKAMLQRLRIGFSQTRRFVLIGADNTGPLRLARKVMGDQLAPLIHADMEGLLKGGDDALMLLMGEAKLRRAGVYVDKIELLDRPDVPPTVIRRIFDLFSRLRVPQFFRATYGLSADMRLEMNDTLGAVELRLQLPNAETRESIWGEALAPILHIDDESSVEQVAHAARAYPFGVDEIHRAIALARLQARQRDLRSPKIRPSDIVTACNTLSSRKIGQLAQRVEVRARWEDVVLTDTTKRVIDEITRFGTFQNTVFEDHGYGGKMGYGKGLTCLFWGPPGTGKTLVSGLIARELGLELYRIELSQVVSKYIGETEERLGQIFEEAVASDMAILFDEADSLFASRTEVKSSVDRYANLEVNFLLQKIEHHDGVVILTTNFPKSIDEAFMRRIRFKAQFPAPGPPERMRLWEKMIPKGAPRDEKIRFDALGEVYEMTGGEIRNAVLRAAFYAVEEGKPLGLEHLDRSAQVEYREAGRLLNSTALKWIARQKSPAKRIFTMQSSGDRVPEPVAERPEPAANVSPPASSGRAPSPMEVERARKARMKSQGNAFPEDRRKE